MKGGSVKRDNVEDLYTLSPVQEGILFHSLHGDRPGAYLQQFVYALEGNLEVAIFERAWQMAVDRCPALRTAFIWERQGSPLQVVLRRVSVRLLVEQWPESGDSRQELAAFLRQDQARGFDLRQPPLMRLTLALLDGETSYLIWTYHHLVLDGWSMALVLREVLDTYRALSAGRAPDERRRRPFSDYIAWLKQQDLGAAEGFWRRVLAGFTHPTPLPGRADIPAAGKPTYRRLTLASSQAALETLRRAARKRQLTLNTLAQGAWALLLSRYNGLDDVLFGTVVSGRPAELAGVESMIGMFINTLPTRVRIAPRAKLGSWLAELQAEQIRALDYSFTPLTQIRRWSDVPAGSALFESILVFENASLFTATSREPAATSLRLRHATFEGETSYPLTVVVEPGRRLSLTLGYDTGHVEHVTAHRLLRHMATLLERMPESFATPVFSLAVLSPAEQHQIVVEWNDSDVDLPTGCLHHLFSRRAARGGEAVALRRDGEQLSYGDLDRRANRLAHRLRALGVGPDVVVGILMRRSIERILAVWGVLKAGGAYLPLDPDAPPARLNLLLAGTPVLVTRGDLAAALELLSAVTVRLDADARRIACCPDVEPEARVSPDHLAYVIHTSGSTGQPKGVMVPHREISATLAWRQTTYPLGPDDRVLQTTAFGFDASLWSIFAPLLAGAQLILSLPEGSRGSARLADVIERHGITGLQLPPAWLRLFLEEPRRAAGAIRFIICGGEALSPKLQKRSETALPTTRLSNLYGPTEAALDTTFWICRRSEMRRQLPIGRPIAKKQTYVLDPMLRLVPAGFTGEILIGGAGLARGYRNDPALTATRFVPHLWSRQPGSRLYRSGDLVRHLDDGNLEFLGRADRQVKVRGARIELGEIEARLQELEDVAQGTVVVRDDLGEGERLVAYVVPRAGSSPSSAGLRDALARHLPELVVPTIFVLLDRLPLTPNGKVDRARLPAPDAVRPEIADLYVAPRNDRERRLAEIWAKVLGVDRVGVHDNFFELGGDSILSLQIVARAHQRGLAISTRQLFENQTIAELAAAGAGEVHAVITEQGPVTGSLPLLPIQHWFFETVRTDRHHWNQPLLLTARRRLDPAALEAAVRAVLTHHDALRLRFAPGDDGWEGRIALPDLDEGLARVDLAALPPRRRPGALESAAAEIQTSLDLSFGPLLRAALFELGSSQRLLLAAHHLAVDGVSWRILLEDLTSAYVQLERREPLRLPPKTTSVRHWAERLYAMAQAAELEDELGFWLDMAVAGAPLPRDRPAGANLERTAETVRVELDPDATRTLLREVPKAYAAQIDEVLLTAVAATLSAWSGSTRLSFELEGHGREDLFDEVDLSRTVGWFTTQFPVTLEVGDLANPGRALRAVKERLRSLPNRGLGFGLLRYLRERPEARRQLAELPRPEVIFNYLGQFDGTLSEAAPWTQARESPGPARSPKSERLHVLDLSGSVVGGRLFFSWSYSRDLHRRATIERLAEEFLRNLRRLIAHCAAPRAGGYAPRDFPLARIDAQTLDRLASSGRRIEDVYPLSPMQQGILFAGLFADQEEVDVLQLDCRVSGDVDVDLFAAGWLRVGQRHPALRTSFVWEGCDEPQQVVWHDVGPSLEAADWRALPEAEQSQRLEELAARRRRELDLGRPPLVRLDLVRLGDRLWRFVWTSHHLILDGWSTPVLFGEFLALYVAQSRGEEASLPAARPYRDYIAWLEKRDMAAAEEAWRRALSGFQAAPLRPWQDPAPGDSGAAELAVRLPPAATAALEGYARRHRLTLNTLVQGAWALILEHAAGSSDVVFGITVSGRPADLAGVENMVGLFINTLPVRVRLPAAGSLAAWLRAHQQSQAELGELATTPLARIQQWAALPEDVPLFETILVFENYPAVTAGRGRERAGLRFDDMRYRIRESFPLILDVGPGSELSLRLKYEKDRYSGAALSGALEDLESLLRRIGNETDTALSALRNHLVAADENRRRSTRQALERDRRERLRRVGRRGIKLTRTGSS